MSNGKFEPTNPIQRDQRYFVGDFYSWMSEESKIRNSVICKNCGKSYGRHFGLQSEGLDCVPNIVGYGVKIHDFVNPK